VRQIGQLQLQCAAVKFGFGKFQQQTEGVAIRGQRVGADLALPHEPLHEEVYIFSAERAHGSIPLPKSIKKPKDDFSKRDYQT
jgi:S-adenosylmethionine:tRNA-ribosyltransferase-isomerase (queuine synthetase)